MSIGRLDGVVSKSREREAWTIAAGLAGIRHLLALDGVLLDQQQIIDGLCGLLPSAVLQEVDKPAVGRMLAIAFAELPLPPDLLTLFEVQRQRVPLMAGVHDRSITRADGSSSILASSDEEPKKGLEATVSRLATLLGPLQHMSRDAATVAAARIGCSVPATLMRAGVTATALPCLSAIRPGMWLAAHQEERVARLYEALALQAEEALALHSDIANRRADWRTDPGKAPGSDRARLAFALLAALPIISRTMLTAVLQSTPRGAEKAVERWVRDGRIEWVRYGKEKFLKWRKQRDDLTRALTDVDWDHSGFAAAAEDADAALREMDRLLNLKTAGLNDTA